MKKRFETIDEYIAAFPGKTGAILRRIRRTIRQAAPEAAERISYQIPSFTLEGKSLIYYGAHEGHIGVYPVPSSGSAALRRELRPYIKGKGTIRLPLDRPIPYDLVKRIALALVDDARGPRRRPAPTRGT